MIRRWLSRGAAVVAAVPAALWIMRHERLIRRGGRPLRKKEAALARALGIRRCEDVRIMAVPRIPSPLGGRLAPLERLFGFQLSSAAGVALGYGIYLSEERASAALMAHELVHVRQYEDLGGPLPFIHQYFYECGVLGYLNAPLEVEARHLSHAHTRG